MVLLSTAVSVSADLWGGPSSDQPHPSVVRVVVSEGQTMSLGSGTLVAVRGRHGMVVTNWHVVRDATGPVNVIFPDGFRSGATILGTDAEWDLAALAIWRPSATPVPLSRQTPQLDDKLSIAGYGSGKYRMASGRCVQYISPGNNQPFEMLELSTAAREGDSGGPIFNDKGELAGVLFGATRGRTAGSYCGRVAWFLNKVAPRFDALSAPPSESSDETMLAEDLPAPSVAPRPSRTPATEVALAPSPASADSTWESAPAPTPKPARRAPPRRAMPLVSIPAPSDEPLDEPSSQPAGDSSESTDWDDSFLAPMPAASAAQPVLASQGVGDTSDPEADASSDPKEVPVNWAELAGATRPEQVRNVLALIGLVTIILQALRVFSVFGSFRLQPVKRPRRRTATRRRAIRVW